MEVNWPVFMDKCVDSSSGTIELTGGGTMEHAIGRMKNGQVFYGIFFDMDDNPDPIGEVFWFDNELDMRDHLIKSGDDYNDENFSPEIANELLSMFKAL